MPPAPAKKMKKGELLFNEGDPSKAMYFIQAGTIRLFKKKGNSAIELGLIHKGEVIGEMGFLDGGPRSASAEAIHDTDLVEITNAQLAEQLKVLPPWLIVLLKTVVNRLRTASKKISQLESASTAYTYGSEGVSTQYQFLTVYDVMKILTACLLTSTRNGTDAPGGGKKVSQSKILRYANQIMGVHENKLTEMLDIMEQGGLAKVDKAQLDKIEVFFLDLDQIEMMIGYINDENLKEHSKKTIFSIKGVAILGTIVKHIALFPPASDGTCDINLAKIIKIEKDANGGKEPFRMDEFAEIVKLKLSPEPAFKDNDNIIAKMNGSFITKLYKIQKFLKQIETVNEQKREQANRGTNRYAR